MEIAWLIKYLQDLQAAGETFVIASIFTKSDMLENITENDAGHMSFAASNAEFADILWRMYIAPEMGETLEYDNSLYENFEHVRHSIEGENEAGYNDELKQHIVECKAKELLQKAPDLDKETATVMAALDN